MSTFNKLLFKGGGDGAVLIQLHDDTTFVQYAINDAEEAFSTLDLMAKCLNADMQAKGVTFSEDYVIECEDACAGMMNKFSEPQMRAIIKVLYEGDIPSDLDVLAQELQMRMN